MLSGRFGELGTGLATGLLNGCLFGMSALSPRVGSWPFFKGDAMAPEAEYVSMDDGCRLWASVNGTGAPLVLCHGGPGLWNNLEALEALLADRVTVIRYDQRGCGGPPAAVPIVSRGLSQTSIASAGTLASNNGSSPAIPGAQRWPSPTPGNTHRACRRFSTSPAWESETNGTAPIRRKSAGA